MTIDVPPAKPPYDLERMVVTAFKAARDRGKPDWQRMKVAVLKSRLLQLTRGTFAEHFHGAATFREVLGALPGLIRVEGDTVELLKPDGSAEESGAPPSAERVRVRRDLWDAVMDYASGRSYAWEEASGVVRAAAPEEPRLLPTLSREEMAGWREEFAAGHASGNELKDWVEKGLGTRWLPPRLRGPWNGFVRSKVEDRLRAWFKQHGLTAPAIVEDVQPTTPTEVLRQLVISCVSVMTDAELKELRISPAVLLRAQKQGNP